MTTISNPEVLSWKHPGLEGIKTRNGEIIDFPGGIPTQAEVDAWLAEYNARDTDAERVERSFQPTDRDVVLFETLFELVNRVLVLEGGAVITRPQFKSFLKSKLPS